MARFTLWYFALVFGAGFALGVLRTLLLEPRLGSATAQFVELPFMVVISLWAAGFCLRRLGAELSRTEVAFAGAAAVLLLFGFELVLVLGLRGETPGAWLQSRLSPPGIAYLISVLAFGCWPWVLYPRTRRR
ncbi:MAG: hypothetical protein V2I63_02215 [Pseudomonadales bacterium]|jgi:hypothetical protein|nr:hypothetical protein [Pseudomonadales bacterium]